jgi:hypothetical protein
LRELPLRRAFDRDGFARPLLLREALRFDFPEDRRAAVRPPDFAALADFLAELFTRFCTRFAVLATLLAFFAARLTVRRAAGKSGFPLADALPAMAPTTPPTTAPKGPATLPIAAPATAPAVSFGIEGILMSSDASDWAIIVKLLTGSVRLDTQPIRMRCVPQPWPIVQKKSARRKRALLLRILTRV